MGSTNSNIIVFKNGEEYYRGETFVLDERFEFKNLSINDNRWSYDFGGGIVVPCGFSFVGVTKGSYKKEAYITSCGIQFKIIDIGDEGADQSIISVEFSYNGDKYLCLQGVWIGPDDSDKKERFKTILMDFVSHLNNMKKSR